MVSGKFVDPKYKKTKYMLFKNRAEHVHLDPLKIGDEEIERVGENCNQKYFKFLGHVLDEQLTFKYHFEHVTKKLNSANYALSSSKHFLPLSIKMTIYRCLFESHLQFGNIVWGAARLPF